jgi:hypothetical protein
VKVEASPAAIEHVRGRGGCLFLWAGEEGVRAATSAPFAAARFERYPGAEFDLLLDPGLAACGTWRLELRGSSLEAWCLDEGDPEPALPTELPFFRDLERAADWLARTRPKI